MSPSFTADPQRGPEELQDLYNRQARAISQATSALTHSTTFIEGFFSLLRKELAFYVGCLNLTEHMRRLGVPFCIPTILPMESRDRSWHNMYDLSLALTKNNNQVVGNDLDAVNKRLYIITGANQGGKSTFLRSLGQSQLMAQCGMPAPATSISFPIRRNLLTHFKKEEDRFMKSGKLDEELTRMNRLADHIERYSMVLFNESFASTNEREGSEICQQITQALTDNDVEVFSVTHLFMFATKYIGNSEAQFLMAERREDSQRTFKIIPGEPLETAFGEDLYQKIFVQAGMTLS
jgi:DNA mismatch repair ATPase MutS